MRTTVPWKRVAVFAFILALGLSRPLSAQRDTDWRISPARINITLGEARRLQILDDSARQLNDATWSVDDSSVVVLERTQTGAIVHALSAGVVRVSATIGHETRYADIRIWPGDLPAGTTKWGIDPIGKELGDISAVPNSQSIDEYALEQTRFGDTYLRANEEDGIQAWTWQLPDDTADVELVCGDWLGGAVVSAHRSNSYTLYDIGPDGKVRWQRTAEGYRRSLAISTDGVVYLLNQSLDNTAADLAAIDQATGDLKFDLPIPSSQVTLSNVEPEPESPKFVCSSVTRSDLFPIVLSNVYVNMDGKAYVAFSQETSVTISPACQTGSVMAPAAVSNTDQQRILLWQIHEDGTYRSTVLDVAPRAKAESSSITISPTGALVTDDRNGLLIPVRKTVQSSLQDDDEVSATELIYRVDPDGNVLYKFPLPNSTGRLEDEMVIGKDEVGFATRSGTLYAFQVADGKQLWQWRSNTPEITVFAALANGDCIVQTPSALVEVQDDGSAKELGKGHFMLDWRGQVFRKHD